MGIPITRDHLEAYRIIIYYQVPSFKIQADTFMSLESI